MGYGGILEPYWLGYSTSVFYNSICISVCIFICTKSHVTFLVKTIKFTDARPQLTNPLWFKNVSHWPQLTFDMIRFIVQSNSGWCVIELQKLNISNAPLLEYFYQGVKKYQLYFDYENIRSQRAKFADPENYTYHKRNEPRSSLRLL